MVIVSFFWGGFLFWQATLVCVSLKMRILLRCFTSFLYKGNTEKAHQKFSHVENLSFLFAGAVSMCCLYLASMCVFVHNLFLLVLSLAVACKYASAGVDRMSCCTLETVRQFMGPT
uniref:Uncharacterized protein n=1 Tax=Ixodes scapularis TaxID=6945 RepID=A0A4D5S193_IXOSC